MKIASGWILIIFISGFVSCGTIKQTSKYQLYDGHYNSTLFNHKDNSVYIDNNEDTIVIYRINRYTKSIDSSTVFKKNFPQIVSDISLQSTTFKQASIDIDFLTIPFKYRNSEKGFPKHI